MTVEQRIFHAGIGFDAAYKLLTATFAHEALANRESFEEDFRATSLDGMSPFIMYARFAAPNVVSGVICGAYIPLSERRSIGFIEYLVVHPDFRSRGEGSALLLAFERELARIATNRGDRLALIIGEAVPAIVRFKVRHGYRWPMGSIYLQPPIHFDNLTGLPQTQAVPLTLMVKTPTAPETWTLSTETLLAAVQTIFRTRYQPCFSHQQTNPQATHISQAILAELFCRFQTSLSDHCVPLVIPDWA